MIQHSRERQDNITSNNDPQWVRQSSIQSRTCFTSWGCQSGVASGPILRGLPAGLIVELAVSQAVGSIGGPSRPGPISCDLNVN